MQYLSNLNDLAGSWVPLATAALAAVLLFLLIRKQEALPLQNLGLSTRAYAVTLTLAAVWITIQFIFLEADQLPWGGSDRYFVRAMNIIEHGVFGSGLAPTALFPPGYSFLLLPAILVLGNSPWAFFLTNLLLLIGHSLVFRRILIFLGTSSLRANLFAAALVIYPNRLFGSLLPFSDVPFSLFWLTAFGLLLASNRSPGSAAFPILAGASAGVAVLIRSSGILYLIPLLAGILIWSAERKLRRAVLFVALSAAILAPWTIRNFGIFTMLVPVSTNGGYNLLVGNNPTSGAGWNRYVDTSRAVAASLADAGGSQWTEAQRDRFYGRLALANIVASPSTALLRSCLKIAKTFGTDGYSFGLLETYTNAREITIDMVKDSPHPAGTRRFVWALYTVYYHIVFILSGVLYYLLTGLTIQRLWAGRHGRTDAWWVMVLLLLCIALTVSLTFGLSRLKEPMTVAMLLTLGAPLLRKTTSPQRG